MPKPTECNHEWETSNGLMYVCKHCGVGRRQPDPWPVTDAAINAVTVLNKSAYILAAQYDCDVAGDHLKLEVCSAGGREATDLYFDHVGPQVYQSLVESGMGGRWSLVLISENNIGGSEVTELNDALKNASYLLKEWFDDCQVEYATGRPPQDDLTTRGERLVDKARAAWLRGVFGEASAPLLWALRDALRRARRELVHLDGARRLLVEETDAAI